MVNYRSASLPEARQQFRRNRNPGPGVVQGLGTLGTLQQVLWLPAHDTHRRATTLRKDAVRSTRLNMLVYSRGGNLLASHPMMDSIATAGSARQLNRIRQLSHFVTTSAYGEAIAGALSQEARLPKELLDPDDDRYHTQGVSGLIIAATVAPHRVMGGRPVAGSFLLVHRPARPHTGTRDIYHDAPTYDTLGATNFDPGVGVGAHAYGGVQRQPFTGNGYPFPLGDSAENTLDIYADLLGKRRGVNIAVRELVGHSVAALAVSNASGESA